MRAPYLSIVVGGTNRDPITRELTRDFFGRLLPQLDSSQLDSEILLVDWNPSETHTTLKNIAQTISSAAPARIRAITVPGAIHQGIPNSDRISYFPQFAKNVGIRRSMGQFVLTTSLDARFSDALIGWIAQRALDETHIYTCSLERAASASSMSLAHSALPLLPDNFIARAHRRLTHRRFNYLKSRIESHFGRVIDDKLLQGVITYLRQRGLDAGLKEILDELAGYLVILPEAHSESCDHFLLMSRERFLSCRGIPELPISPRYLNTLGLCAAARKGTLHLKLGSPLNCSLATAPNCRESSLANDRALTKNGIPFLTHGRARSLAFEMFLRGGNFLNSEGWGLARHCLQELSFFPPSPSLGVGDLLRQLQLPVTELVHVGAHIGQEVDEYIRAGVENVWWIEANPELIPRLKDTVCRYPGQKAILALLADRDGEERFLNISSNDGASSSILEMGTHLKYDPNCVFTGRKKLTTVTLDTLASHVGLRPDFISLDVQGAELLVLRGATRVLRGVRGIYTEVSTEEVYRNGARLEQIDSFLAAHGFNRRFISLNMLSGTHGNALYLRTGRAGSDHS